MGSENQNGFVDFSDFRKNFLTILVFDDSIYYIDQNSFLATAKLTHKKSLRVYFFESIRYEVRKSKWVF